MRIALISLVCALALGCGDDSTPADSGPGDGGMPDSATMTDGGSDAAMPDAGSCDPGAIFPGRGELSAVMDQARGRIIVYAGNLASPLACMPNYSYTDEVWAFDTACETWTKLSVTAGPGARARGKFVLDVANDRALLFGGRQRSSSGVYTLYNETWAFDFGTDSWSQLATTGDAPSPRSNAVAGLDADGGRLIIFGGNTSSSGLSPTGSGDTYALDLGTNVWSRIDATGGPSPRYYHAGVVVDRELVVFGGTPDFAGPFLNDTYAFNFDTNTWRMVAPGGAGAPEARFGMRLYADEVGGRALMVAGHDFTDLGNRNDVWAVDLASGVWTRLVQGDVLHGTAAGACDFPADFTTPDLNAPERRFGFGRAQTGTTGWVLAGKSDCGNVNDVWKVDLTTGAWTPAGLAATEGEACNRSGAVGCTTLCY